MQLHRDRDLLDATGAGVFLIGNGAASFIEGFREATGYAGPVFTDPTRAAFDAAALLRGVGVTLNLATVRRSIGAYRRGYRQGSLQGDPFQQGGVLVIAPGGEVRWRHVSRGPGDNATAAEIAAALRAAR